MRYMGENSQENSVYQRPINYVKSGLSATYCVKFIDEKMQFYAHFLEDFYLKRCQLSCEVPFSLGRGRKN